MKLYLDEDMSPKVAHALRQRGHDVLCAHEAGNDGLSDDAQLRHAAEQGRHLVTYNRRDFLAVADPWFRVGKSFPTILLLTEGRCPRHEIGAQAAALESQIARAAGGPNLTSCVIYV